MRQYTSATYLVAMVTRLPWQPELNLNNSFVLSLIEVILGMKLPCNDRHQPHTSLLWKLSCHGNESETLITHLSQVVLSSYLVWRLLGTTGISHIPRCYGNSVTMATGVDDRHQSHTLLLW